METGSDAAQLSDRLITSRSLSGSCCWFQTQFNFINLQQLLTYETIWKTYTTTQKTATKSALSSSSLSFSFPSYFVSIQHLNLYDSEVQQEQIWSQTNWTEQQFLSYLVMWFNLLSQRKPIFSERKETLTFNLEWSSGGGDVLGPNSSSSSSRYLPPTGGIFLPTLSSDQRKYW